MELDLNSLNGKSILILGGVLIAVLLADRYQGIPRSMLLRWQYNSDRQTLTRDPDIAADLERKESLRLRALHKTINDELTTAELKGFEVSRLRSISDQALLLDNTIYRPAAFERLQKLRLAIPQ